MPVKRRSVGVSDAGSFRELAEELAHELTHPKEFGQPLVDEETFARTGLLGVTVIWDKWAGVPELKRPGVILEAYKQAKGAEEKDRIAFAIGMTVQEAAEAGKLPYSILPALRRTDVITPEQAKALMLEFGGSAVEGDFPPVMLQFLSLDDAEACRRKLIERHPGSNEIWQIAKRVPPPEWAW